MKKIATKIWLLVLGFLVITILFMYSLTNFLYERLYVQDKENNMVGVGQKLATMYEGGKVTNALIDDVDRYNMYADVNVFAVRNPRELSACVPFDIDYDTLIGPQERKQLLAGETVTKQGYEKRFDRQVISVIVPLVHEKRLEGILYLYFPLEKIVELAKKDILLISTGALLFLMMMALAVMKGIQVVMKPLNRLQLAAKRMADGHYDERVVVTSKDEIGQLTHTFNEMATAIQKTDDTQKEFLANVSHELRTPISYVKGYSEALAKGLIPKEECTEKLNLITQEADRMEKLTAALLQLSRSEKLEEFTKMPIVLAESLREALQLSQQRAMEKQMTLHLKADESLIIAGDDEKMKQIMLNLIENSLRYSDKETAIYVEASAEKTYAKITVRDEGIGIADEHLPHLAERFYRVNKARTRADGGSGLGLSIVDQLIALHGGSWHITSTWQVGTTVTLFIPLWEDFDEVDD
ncbi:sensor histidine kinase [Kurthia senegalensis]|uniref:sensor histidine kinase n=1 Tax=Kurthia senegalensis TaxID=1033740 RepID=UPI000289467F|nr:ATP-binding protein [Kurthia senegalensis]